MPPMSGEPAAWRKAADDVAAGRRFKAFERLRSWTSNSPYDGEAFARIGRVQWEMGDRFWAGRWWLLSSAEGSDVDDAVAAYLAAFAGDVDAALAQLPYKGLSTRAGDLAPQARARLRALGRDVDARPNHSIEGKALRDDVPMTWGMRLSSYGCLALILLAGAGLVIGTLGWIVGGLGLLLRAAG